MPKFDYGHLSPGRSTRVYRQDEVCDPNTRMRLTTVFEHGEPRKTSLRYTRDTASNAIEHVPRANIFFGDFEKNILTHPLVIKSERSFVEFFLFVSVMLSMSNRKLK